MAKAASFDMVGIPGPIVADLLFSCKPLLQYMPELEEGEEVVVLRVSIPQRNSLVL